MSTDKTLDEVIAENVRRLREERGWSVGWLAAFLDVGRHLVYDIEGGRGDRPQREFRWSELVSLCAVFQVTLFELVLPAEGVAMKDPRLVQDKWGDLIVAMSEAAEGELPSRLTFDRDLLSELVFGGAASPDSLALLASKAADRRKARDAVIAEAADKLKEIYQDQEE